MNNPYHPTLINPQLCYGRYILLGELMSGLPGSMRKSFAITGARRMGKTTLLRRLEIELDSCKQLWEKGGVKIIPIYIDGMALPAEITQSYLWNIIISNVQEALNHVIQTHNNLDFSLFKSIALSTLSQTTLIPRIIVIFDEIERIIPYEWSKAYWDHWRALLSNTPGISEFITAVFCGAREMNAFKVDLTSPLRDILEWHNLYPLDYEDACSLMQEPINTSFPEIFLQRVYEESGGHPMLIQYFMQYICEHPLNDAEHWLEEAIKKFHRERRWQFSDWWEKYCSTNARDIYTYLSAKNEPASRRELTRTFGSTTTDEAVEILLHVGIIKEEDDGFTYRVNGQMFHKWYLEYGILDQEPQYDHFLLERLNSVDPDLGTILGDKYISAWKIFQSSPPNYSGTLVELRGILEMLLDKFAPKSIVAKEPDFKPESGKQEASLRQQLRYYIKKKYKNNETTKELVNEYNLLELQEQLANISTKAHRTASSLAHETATKDQAYQAIKQWESIFYRLLPEKE